MHNNSQIQKELRDRRGLCLKGYFSYCPVTVEAAGKQTLSSNIFFVANEPFSEIRR